MFSAFDEKGNIIYAEDCEKGLKCYCKVCGEPLTLRKGEINRPHFAHNAKSNCSYDDRDNKSPWHIRMQDYFPRETREYLFIDNETGERHIVDVFINDKNTVIEFQHSHISGEEFAKRTLFHIKNQRRIVWIFDESVENPKPNCLGRLRPDDSIRNDFPHKYYTFKWLNNPRKCLLHLHRTEYRIDYNNYAVFIYSGVEGGDYIHRIIDAYDEHNYVTLSVQNILMENDMDIDDLFKTEWYWLAQPEWKNILQDPAYRYRIEDFLRKQRKHEKRLENHKKYEAQLKKKYNT